MINYADIINRFVHPVLSGMIVLAGLVAAFMIVLGGIGYITSSGSINRLYRSKRTITKALIGLTIVIAAAALSLVLRQTFGPTLASGSQHLPALGSVKPASQSGGFVAVIIEAISGFLGVIKQQKAVQKD